MHEQLLKTAGADVLSSDVLSSYEGVASPPPLSCTSEGCQVVEWVDIFANPVFKNPGMSIILRSVCETLRYTFLAIMSDQVSPFNTAVVSKCSKYRLRK